MTKTKLIITKEQEERINSICRRVNNTLTPIQIRNWFENFQPEELPTALNIIENLKYYTLDEIINEYNQSLQSLLHYVSDTEILFIHGLGKFGKSGSTMIYFIKQTPTYKKYENRFKILLHPNKLKGQGLKENSILVLVDDIIGSGKSLVTYYNQEIKYQLLKDKFTIKVHILCIAFMKDSTKYVSENIPNAEISGTEYIKAFASGTSVFGYRPRMLPVRQICYSYGKNLFSKKNWKTGELEIHPLGFNKSQSLIVFAHSVPNNTLPIIWSTKNGWTPLYPRSSDSKISRIKEFQKETWLWIGIAYKIGIFKTDNTRSIYTKNINFSILAIVRLKKQRRIPPIICQLLGITLNNYKEIIQEGIKRNIFDTSENLTAYGLEVYEKIIHSLKLHHIEENKKQYDFNMIEQYIPKTFLGKT